MIYDILRMRVILFNQLLFDDESLVVVLDLNEIIE